MNKPRRRIDHDWEQIYDRLAVPVDNSPSAISRRRFLQGAAVLGGGALLAGGATSLLPRPAFAGPPLGADDRVLVTILMGGGNDAINTVIPLDDPLYGQLRKSLAVPTGLPVGEGLYLHPNLQRLKTRFDAGDVAILRGIGDPSLDHSHFSAMATWMYGYNGIAPGFSGWVGRYLDGAGLDGLGGITVGNRGIPLHFKGLSAKVTGLPTNGNLFGADRESENRTRLYQTMAGFASEDFGKGPWAEVMADSLAAAVDTAVRVEPIYSPDIDTEDDFVRDMIIAARAINLDVGARAINVSIDGFDTHDAQKNDHEALLNSLDMGIEAFWATLAPRLTERVSMMTFSEFGRRGEMNDSLGTDHGAGGVAFVIGTDVKGGLKGTQPPLGALDQRGDLAVTMDFRRMYATVLRDWMHADDVAILGGDWGTIDVFGACAAASSASAAANGFASVVPYRVLDTRNGRGAPAGKVGRRGSIALDVTGSGGVPKCGVGAVVLNVTVTEPTANSFVTAWPSGASQPVASNLNMVPGETVPNLVMCKVGGDGRVSLFNNEGDTHLIADVAGWFPAADGVLRPLDPARILDTRNGNGAPTGKVGHRSAVELQVTGRGGVPGSDVGAVVMNVTVTEPNLTSYVTVWPSGSARPTASNLNMVPGQTVPNLVMCKVGAGGKVSLYNHNGETHLVADVLSWIPAGETRFTPLEPARLLDTRRGQGGGAVGPQGVLDLKVGGWGGVPPSGATAVVLNVTATEPTGNTYVTVWPTGSARPTASNLNVLPGQTSPNLVVAKLGTDGQVSFYNNQGQIQLIADVFGYFG